MKIAVIIARVLLGLAFTVFGANAFLQFMPTPPMDPATPIGQFMAVMGPSGYMTMIGFFQLIGGLLVLSGRLTPMGLVFLGPILVNIIAFHVFLDNGQNLLMGLIFTALEIFLIYAYRNHFRPIFGINAKPA